MQVKVQKVMAMTANLNRANLVLPIATAVFLLATFTSNAHADIFQWEYINPADPSQGKRRSTTLVPDGSGADAVSGADLSGRDLTRAYLINAELTNAALTGADFTDADIRGATFEESIYLLDPATLYYGSIGTIITLEQLYSTASYQSRDLTGVSFGSVTRASLLGADFRQVNLRDALFHGIELGGADFRQANLTHTSFWSTRLGGANFAGQDLRNTSFYGSSIGGADFTEANVQGTSFSKGFSGDAFVDALGNLRIDSGPSGTGISLVQLYSTASYQARDLRGIDLVYNNLAGGVFVAQNLTDANFDYATLTGADFRESSLTNSYFLRAKLNNANFIDQILSNVSFFGATLTGADFTGSDVRGTQFGRFRNAADRGTGITPAQLYVTTSYQSKDLSRIALNYNNLDGGNFVGQNLSGANFEGAYLRGADFRYADLTNSYFEYAELAGADFTGGDMRGASQSIFIPEDAVTTNLIRADGHITGLDLDAGGLIIVRDYSGDARYGTGPPIPIPITVDQHLAMAPGGVLRIVFDADAWDSTISFAPGIPVTLGGTLELTFADNVNLASQVGRTFDLFNWTGVNPTGAFAVSSLYAWDLSNLYVTGQVTLTAVPEPAFVAVVVSGVLAAATAPRRLSPSKKIKTFPCF
jgi:uncharacterized protein YjbI with pentapeptide repeats